MPREKAKYTVSVGNPALYTFPFHASVFTVVFNKHLHESLEGKKKIKKICFLSYNSTKITVITTILVAEKSIFACSEIRLQLPCGKDSQ